MTPAAIVPRVASCSDRSCGSCGLLAITHRDRHRADPPLSASRRVRAQLGAGRVRDRLSRGRAVAWCGTACRRSTSCASALPRCATGAHRRVDGRYPTEVQPLVDDLNALLEHRDQTVQRAIAKAGDLAHALKTPLAVLAQEAEVADGGGTGRARAVMRQQIERMRRQIDYHLAHARAAASGATPGARCSVLDVGRRTRPHAAHGCTPIAGWRSTSTSIRRMSFAASAKISTRCSATCSTTPASGRGRGSSIAAVRHRRHDRHHGRRRRPGAGGVDARGGAAARRPRGRGGAGIRPRPRHRPRPGRALRRLDRAEPLAAGRPARRLQLPS